MNHLADAVQSAAIAASARHYDQSALQLDPTNTRDVLDRLRELGKTPRSRAATLGVREHCFEAQLALATLLLTGRIDATGAALATRIIAECDRVERALTQALAAGTGSERNDGSEDDVFAGADASVLRSPLRERIRQSLLGSDIDSD